MKHISVAFFTVLLYSLLATLQGKVNVKGGRNIAEVDVSATGDVLGFANEAVAEVPAMQEVDNRMAATFRNAFNNESITLYWVSDKGEEVCMGDIEADSDLVFDTFHSHTFFARTVESHQRAYPRQVTMVPEQHVYTFGPSPSTSSAPAVSNRRGKVHFKYLNHRTTATSAKFRCLVPNGADIYYEDGRGGVPQGTLKLGQEYTVNTYEGHVFFFTVKGDKSKELARHQVSSKKVLYLIEDPASPPAQHFLDHRDKEEAFMAEYEARTGRQWRHYFGPDGPRGPPIHHMHPAEYVGQVHNLTSTEGFWFCKGPKEECQSSQPVALNLEVISTQPKVFVIPNIISDYEVDAILGIAKPRVADSLVGNNDGGGARKSDTRTSRNTWIPRVTSEVTESLFRRAEHLLKIAPLNAHNTEDLQVVNYAVGQKYDNHHDWGVSGYPESRFCTLLLYLNDMANDNAGGETAFPKGANGMGFKAHPGKGSAVLFYNLLEDGNGDDLSLHAALPVHQGEKWVANFWVWDPARK